MIKKAYENSFIVNTLPTVGLDFYEIHNIVLGLPHLTTTNSTGSLVQRDVRDLAYPNGSSA